MRNSSNVLSNKGPARLAAALESRLRHPVAHGDVAAHLMIRLADALRPLDTERGLLEAPGAPARAGVTREPLSEGRIERLRQVLELARRLEAEVEHPGTSIVSAAVASAPGGIAGTVTRQSTGAPAAGAIVSLYTASGSFLDEVVTGADGTYHFEGLADRDFLARAMGTGLIGGAWDGVSCPCSLTNCLVAADPIQVAGSVVSGVNLALATGGTISGVVTDSSTGDPVAAYVSLYSSSGSKVDGLSTDVDGTYVFDGVPAGTYFLRVSAQGYLGELYDDIACATSCSAPSGTPVTVTEGTATSGVDFVLDPLGAITGTVTYAGTGDPIPNPMVSVYLAPYTWWGSVVGSEDGTYRVDDVPPGSYYVDAVADGFQREFFDDFPCPSGCSDPTQWQSVAVSLNQTTAGIDFSLDRLGTVTGTVTDAVTGAPIAAASIDVYYGPHSSDSTTSGADGTFSIPVQPATFYLRTSALAPYRDEAWDDVPCYRSCVPTVGTPLDVPLESTTSGVDFALDRFGAMTGTAISSESGAGVQGEVAVLDENGDYVAPGVGLPSGVYEVPGLETGRYYVLYSPFYISPTTGFEAELFDGVPCAPSCDLSAGTLLDVALNAPPVEASFVLAPCPAVSYNVIKGETFWDDQTEEACHQLTAGAGTTVPTGVSVTFEAGRSIVLSDGFKVESGASFRAVIEPSWTKNP